METELPLRKKSLKKPTPPPTQLSQDMLLGGRENAERVGMCVWGVTSDCNLVGGSKLEGRFSPFQQLPVK